MNKLNLIDRCVDALNYTTEDLNSRQKLVLVGAMRDCKNPDHTQHQEYIDGWIIKFKEAGLYVRKG